jgi:hypothetical protein
LLQAFGAVWPVVRLENYRLAWQLGGLIDPWLAALAPKCNAWGLFCTDRVEALDLGGHKWRFFTDQP